MINAGKFYELLRSRGVDFFTGVPDSLLKDVCAYIKENSSEGQNIIAANEGNAIGLAAGYHLATGKIPLVYMQNSGLGNIVNPLTSLTDPLVYSIPMLLMIGWRGEPGKKDEPQHKKQGLITLELLNTIGVKFSVFDSSMSIEEAEIQLEMAFSHMRANNEPYALVIKKETFETYKLKTEVATELELTREDAIKTLAAVIGTDGVILSTTGMSSRELFEYREEVCQGHERDFLTVGSMGHASQIALGIALAKEDKMVYCLDGDGALIMHMGSLAVIGANSPPNFKHIVINNGAHDSVGGQPTAGFYIDIPAIAKACGYKNALTAETREDIIAMLGELQLSDGPSLLEIKVKKGARKDLGRPTTTPIKNKESFMELLSK
jgi:phosphonopyruvate decarboxylase